MREYLNFDKLITPMFIKFIFWIGVALTVIMGLIMIVSGASSPFGGGGAVFSGFMMIIIGPLVVRIYCELLIIFFKMHESLHNLDKKMDIVMTNQADKGQQ